MHNFRYGYHPGLIGILGGIINLTTATLYGGSSLVRGVVERAVWQGASDCCSSSGTHNNNCGCQPVRHIYCVECVPSVHKSCCR